MFAFRLGHRTICPFARSKMCFVMFSLCFYVLVLFLHSISIPIYVVFYLLSEGAGLRGCYDVMMLRGGVFIFLNDFASAGIEEGDFGLEGFAGAADESRCCRTFSVVCFLCFCDLIIK